MTISEATKKAVSNSLGIIRESICKDLNRYSVIIPTNSYDCCIFALCENGRLFRVRWWNPTLDDLMADDWQTVAIKCYSTDRG